MHETNPSTKAANHELPGYDIFCTPENSDFVFKVPYQSLSTTEREIPLLKILPGSGSGFVECELLPIVKLADVQKQYLALSYCAGSAKKTETILVNGVKSNVFANLHHALMEARHYWQTHADQQDFLLWVDQICINQFDLAERSHQVGFMRDIYEKERHTLICLSTPEAHRQEMRWHMMRRRGLQLDSCGFIKVCHPFDIEMPNEPQRSMSLGVAMSPWWTRAWVFQEFMVSSQATFPYGSHPMSFLDLATLVADLPARQTPSSELVLSALKLPLAIDEATSYRSKVIAFLLPKLNESGTTDLKVLLSCTRNCQATDKRDKVYSILGLADPGYGIVPDYSGDTDLNDLVVETTKKIILFDDSLEVLWYLDRRKPFYLNPRGTLPSWVLDWTDSASFGRLSNLTIAPRNLVPRFSSFQSDGITPISLDAIFMQVPHPQCLEAHIEVIQVWAVLIDDDFYETRYSYKIRDNRSITPCFKGSRGFVVVSDWSERGISCDDELWAIRGAVHPFLLSKYSYGYRIVGFAHCINLDEKMESVFGIAIHKTNEWKFNISKMQETRITLF